MKSAFDTDPYLGLDFSRVTMDGLLARLREGRCDSPFGYIVTPNVDHIVRLHDRTFADRDAIVAAYRGANLCLCDSRVLAGLAHLSGIALSVIPGSDLTEQLLARVAEPGDRIAIVGSTVDAVTRLRACFPHLVFVEHFPPMGLRHDPVAMEAAASFVASVGARFALLAIGSPQQELLAALIATLPGARGTGLCIGAGVDFLTGAAMRAPRWMQRLGLEWAHRLASDPARLWRRYLVSGPRIFRLAIGGSRRQLD